MPIKNTIGVRGGRAVFVCDHCLTEFEDYIANRTGPKTYCSVSCGNRDRPRIPWQERFWAKVDKQPDGCWLWTAGCIPSGYGIFGIEPKKLVLAHRVSYELVYGLLAPGQNVCHDCDRLYPPGDSSYRKCVRPDHLFSGTQSENVSDMVTKRRQAVGGRTGARVHPEAIARGEHHGCAKLTGDAVREIRRRFAAGEMRPMELARTFGVSPSTMTVLLHGKTWQDECYHPT